MIKTKFLPERFLFVVKTRVIVRAALIAATYVILCTVLSPLSYGPVQIRLSEALTLLPVICPEAILGVSVGCLLANMLTGSLADMIIGTLATLIAAVCSYLMRNTRFKGTALPASLPPVIFNAVAVGAMLTVLYFPPGSAPGVYAFNMLTVGIGQVISCSIFGTLLISVIEKNEGLLKLFSNESKKNS